MADDFNYDVFLSHSAKNLGVVRAVAERLRADGLRASRSQVEAFAKERGYTQLIRAAPSLYVLARPLARQRIFTVRYTQ